MARRLASFAVLGALTLACFAFTASPAQSAMGGHAVNLKADCGAIQVRSIDAFPTTFTIFVRAGENVYFPAQTGVIAPQSMLMMPVPPAGPGSGPLYITSFSGGGCLYTFHPDEWVWDF